MIANTLDAHARVLPDTRPLVMHVLYRFDMGGLENGVVNLLNNMSTDAYRHVVVSITDVTDFRRRVQRDDVEFISLKKPPGHGIWMYGQVFRLIRRMRPSIVHTRNLAALEFVVPAWLARVPVRIHGEHGRDVEDARGTSAKYRWLRRVYMPFVSHYCALSRDLADYLVDVVGVPQRRVTQVYNGVDATRFRPAPEPVQVVDCKFSSRQHFVLGSVGRMQHIKDPVLLARAFVRAIEMHPPLRERLRIVMVGDGPLRQACAETFEAAGLSPCAWLPGERNDVSDIMRSLSCFVLPSLAEGISNTILEAMACGLPVIATDVGGNADLVTHGETGVIVPSSDVHAMATAIVELATDPARATRMGRAGRIKAEQHFSLVSMVATYQRLYDDQLNRVTELQET
jgi:sugar transferase (PEP-CTERM/EpsH1 system associated)